MSESESKIFRPTPQPCSLAYKKMEMRLSVTYSLATHVIYQQGFNVCNNYNFKSGDKLFQIFLSITYIITTLLLFLLLQ